MSTLNNIITGIVLGLLPLAFVAACCTQCTPAAQKTIAQDAISEAPAALACIAQIVLSAANPVDVPGAIAACARWGVQSANDVYNAVATLLEAPPGPQAGPALGLGMRGDGDPEQTIRLKAWLEQASVQRAAERMRQ